MVMMYKATPEDRTDAREKLYTQISQLEAEIKKLQANPKKNNKNSSGSGVTTTIIIVIGVVAVFGIALATGILIQ